MRFADIAGNEAVKDALRGMVDSGRIPHAILLYENDGGGALPLALAFLTYLYCQDRRDGEACGGCPPCNRNAKLIHPDVHFVFPVTGGSKVSTDKPLSASYAAPWRELVLSNPCFTESELYTALGIEGKSGAIAVHEAKSLLEQLSLSGVEGGWRTVVMYLPEKMNLPAANTLLKMVEEPPAQTLFLLITHAPEKVLPTIASRCLSLRVLPPPQQAAWDAGQMDLFADLMRAVAGKDLLAALEAGDALSALDSREKQKAFCNFAAMCLRGIFLLQQGLDSLAEIPQEYRPFFGEMAQKCRKTFPRAALGYFDRARLLLERNVSQKILFCDLAGRLYTAV